MTRIAIGIFKDDNGKRGGAVQPHHPIRVTLAAFLNGAGTMRTAIICGALMALTLSAANAERVGQYWASRCSEAPEGSAQQTYCRGLVEGILFGLALEMKGLPRDHAPIICPPRIDDVTWAMKAVNYWAAAHPNMEVASLPVLIEFALIAEYPCSR